MSIAKDQPQYPTIDLPRLEVRDGDNLRIECICNTMRVIHNDYVIATLMIDDNRKACCYIILEARWDLEKLCASNTKIPK